ncbi:MAG: hypothetical protein ACLSHE_08650 [Roseburia sp.]
MFRVKYKKEQILKGLRYFSIEIAILWTIILIDTLISTYYGKYSGIHLSQVVASIPKEYMNSEESEHYKTDNEFLIQSKENAYMIYGIELSNVDESSLITFLDEEDLKKLKSANSFSQILEGIQDGVGFLWGDVTAGNTEKPSYIIYYFSSVEKGQDEDYQVYIMFYIKGDLRYMEICIMDEEHALSEKQKEHMELFTR